MAGNTRLNENQMDAVLDYPELKNLVFEGAIRWISVTIRYLRESKIEIEPYLVFPINEIEDAILAGDPEEIWHSYKRFLDKAKMHGEDYLNMPLHFFGRSFH